MGKNKTLSDFNTTSIYTKKLYDIKTQMPQLHPAYPIKANVVCDSVSPDGIRLTTLELIFPRYILAEFNTHRRFSRNASSSRAIPTKKLIQNTFENFVEPVRYGKNQAGMQAAPENLTGEDLEQARRIWAEMADFVTKGCIKLTELGLHKQWASRPVEWFSTIKVVMTSDEFDNFFLLRDHHEAQPEICYLAQAIKIALNESEPEEIAFGMWHLPYITQGDFKELGLFNARRVSAARCARVSYKTNHGLTSTLEEDSELFKRLVHDIGNEEEPFHASPTEHQATPLQVMNNHPSLRSNFQGWVQFRKYIECNRENDMF